MAQDLDGRNAAAVGEDEEELDDSVDIETHVQICDLTEATSSNTNTQKMPYSS